MVNISVTQQDLEVFFVILVRMASFIYVVPFFGQANVPQRVKLGLAITLSYITYLVLPEQALDYDSTLGYATLIIKESATGLLLGFSAFICNSIVSFAGRIIDMDIGLSMSNLFDPASREQITITGALYQQVFFMIFIISRMHIFLLNAIVDSFTVIPLGKISPNILLYTKFIGFLTDYFVIGFRIVLPIFAVILITNCALGIMTKIAPQIHMFSIGMQIKIIAGFIVLMMTVIIMPNVAEFLNDNMKEMVLEVMKGLT